MAKAKQKYYVVWVGVAPGVYTSWDECRRQVEGFEGARYKSFATRAEADHAFAGTPEEYFAKRNAIHAHQPTLDLLPEAAQPQYPALAVDAACSGNPGEMEYRGVDAKTGRVIFHEGPFPEGTNNIGEFLAIVHGLALLKTKGQEHIPIYSDSKIAQSWVRQKRCKTKLPLSDKNRALMNIVSRAEAWLAQNTYQTPILKWHTEAWGEIPADFGRK